jgi:hypothetical protein
MPLPTSSKAQQRPEKQSSETLGIAFLVLHHAARKGDAYEVAASTSTWEDPESTKGEQDARGNA